MPTSTNQYHPSTTTHPGETLREKLEELGMGPKEFALRSGKPEKTISEVLAGKSSITPEMAVQFEHVLQIPARFWLTRQYHYDEYVARLRREEALREGEAWAQQFPYAQMAKLGWVPPTGKRREKVAALFDFFGFSHHSAWEQYFLRSTLKATFRISLASAKCPHPLSAWLRQGERQAEQFDAPPYSEKALRAALPKLKAVMAAQPADFFTQAQGLCRQAGLKVVLTPNLPKAPISGAARWVHERPLAQLSCRYRRYDIFWFSFFHELGHILLHGKKDIFLESIEYSGKDMEKEAEADAFAVQWTLPLEQEEILAASLPALDAAALRRYAQQWQTHPSLIVGRLQYRGLIPHHAFAEWLTKIDLG
jgi:HTH-type transcriptional regulator / antitoxin HigA